MGTSPWPVIPDKPLPFDVTEEPAKTKHSHLAGLAEQPGTDRDLTCCILSLKGYI